MVGEELRLGRRIAATVDATDALHEPHGVPVQFVVDQQ